MKTLSDDAFDDAMNPPPESATKDGDQPADASQPSEEELDEALEETFPASDPIAPSRIDGPNT